MDKKHLTILVLVTAALVVLAVFFLAEKNQNGSQSTVRNTPTQVPEVTQDNQYTVRPDFSKVQTFKNTITLQKGVSVKYGNGWVGKKTGDNEFVNGQLTKTLNGRSYVIGFQENNKEFLVNEGAYANAKLKIYEELQLNGKTHYIFTSSNTFNSSLGSETYDLAYISACPVKTREACSLPIEEGLLFITLSQNVPNAQEIVGLDFSRQDDQQILAEFAEIMSTLQY